MSNIENALAQAGQNLITRNRFFSILAEAERQSKYPAQFRFDVRWPIIQAMIGNGNTSSHLAKLQNGLVFEVKLQSRIEQALLLSLDEAPDYVWEPQTTRLACSIARYCMNVLVGGAYIGDQSLPVANVLQVNGNSGILYAFEPVLEIFEQLTRNIELNNISNIKAEQKALWDHAGIELELQGAPAIASGVGRGGHESESYVKVLTVTIDEYLYSQAATDVGLIMLDMEGAEKQVLVGAQSLLMKNYPDAPSIIFEVHSSHFLRGTSLDDSDIVQFLHTFGYQVFAIRDLQGCLSMEGRAIELLPLDYVYLAEIPHFFNMLATKDRDFAAKYGVAIVNRKLSPKLLSDKNTYLPYPPKNPVLHLPDDGLGLGLF